MPLKTEDFLCTAEELLYWVQSLQLVMNEGYYNLVIAIPLIMIMIVLILTFAWYILIRKLPNSSRWLAAYTFPNIIEKKTDENRQTTWQVRDTNLGEGSALLSKLTTSISLLFLTLAAFTLIMFFYLLLINVSYDCDPDEKSKDCFEFKVWDTDRFSNVPIDCSSAAILNGSVEVVCYEIVFDFSKAVGASYGVFKISIGGLQLLATLILMKKDTKLVTKLQIVMVVAYICLFVTIMVVQFTQLRVYLVSNTIVNVFQVIVIFAATFLFAFLVPWKGLIEKMNE